MDVYLNPLWSSFLWSTLNFWYKFLNLNHRQKKHFPRTCIINPCNKVQEFIQKG